MAAVVNTDTYSYHNGQNDFYLFNKDIIFKEKVKPLTKDIFILVSRPANHNGAVTAIGSKLIFG